MEGFWDYSQGDHGWPPPAALESSNSSSISSCWAVENWVMSMRLLDSALRIAVYPGICGSSGTVLKYLSSLLLNELTLQFVMFLSVLGNVLNSLGPRIAKLEYLRFCTEDGA